MTNDIVARLRGHIAITTRLHYAKDGFPEPVYVHGPSPICQEAADEIERLRAGGCARDQTTTQFCAEAVYLQRELDASRQRNRELVIRQGQLDAEVRNLRNALHDIADNKNNEPYAADHARDALRDAT